MSHYESQHYNLEAYYKNNASKKGWAREDFIWAARTLESMSRDELLALCRRREIALDFLSEGWEKTVPEEEIVGALIADYPPEVLLPAIKELAAK